jgi:2,3-diaminopropionate biosynthesis protein SbnA
MLHRRADQSLIERTQQIRRGLTHTPLIPLADEHCDLVTKLEFCNPTGSSKDRSALWILEQAISRGDITHDTTVIESSSGNFALALAFYCRTLNIPFIPVIDPNCNQATETQLRLLCHRVEKVTHRDTTGSYLKTRLTRIQELLTQLPSPYWPNQYANPDARDAHYRFTAAELLTQTGPLDYLFVGVGTGGTIAGLSHRIKETHPHCHIIAVDAEGSIIFGGPPKKRRIPGIGSSIIPPLSTQALIDHIHIIPETQTTQACHTLATTHGLYAGGSTGSTYAAIQNHFTQHPPGTHRPRVAFIAADRGHPYAQTIYNPTWTRQLHTDTTHPHTTQALATN